MGLLLKELEEEEVDAVEAVESLATRGGVEEAEEEVCSFHSKLRLRMDLAESGVEQSVDKDILRESSSLLLVSSHESPLLLW